MSLKKSVFQSILWTIGDTFFLSGLSFVAYIILARMLGPTAFGLIGMISVFIAIGISLVDSGMSASLIRTSNPGQKDFSTVFILNLVLSILVYLVTFIIAPFIADFFNQDVLRSILRVYALTFIISAFSSVQLAILNKEMKFKQIMLSNIPGTVIGLIVGITLGYNGFGVWSIVYMYIVNQVIKVLVLWIISSWKPQFNYSHSKAKLHFNFGYKLMLSGLIDTIFKNSYNLIIGKLFSVQSLGYFERANSFNDYATTITSGVVGKVTYPLLAKVKDNVEELTKLVQLVLPLTFFISAPLMLCLSALAKPMFLLILGENWAPAIPYFQILCFAGMLYPIHALNVNILKVFGRSDLFLKLEIIKKTVIVIFIFLGLQYDILGLLLANVFSSFIALFINMFFSSKMIPYSIKHQLKDMQSTMITALLMFGIVLGFINLNLLQSNLFNLLGAIFIGTSVFLILNITLKNPSYIFIVHLLKRRKL